MKPSLLHELALDALLMAVWRRRPEETIIVHTDLGSQYDSDDWRRFCQANNLSPSMSWRGNYWDNAVAEYTFSSLKKSASESGSIKSGTWPELISLIISKCSTTKPDATATWEASIQRPSKRPRREDSECLRERGYSTRITGAVQFRGEHNTSV